GELPEKVITLVEEPDRPFRALEEPIQEFRLVPGRRRHRIELLAEGESQREKRLGLLDPQIRSLGEALAEAPLEDARGRGSPLYGRRGRQRKAEHAAGHSGVSPN